MRLTKDEARILAQALNEYKYNVVNEFNDFKELGVFNKLHDLQYKLEMFGDDKRRYGNKKTGPKNHSRGRSYFNSLS